MYNTANEDTKQQKQKQKQQKTRESGKEKLQETAAIFGARGTERRGGNPWSLFLKFSSSEEDLPGVKPRSLKMRSSVVPESDKACSTRGGKTSPGFPLLS